MLTSIYTAFLFAQAKGRDFWQSPILSLHMLGHSLLAGAAVLAFFTLFEKSSERWDFYLQMIIYGGVGFNLLVLFLEMATTHTTADSKRAAEMITSGKYSGLFWVGVILLGNIIPVAIAYFGGQSLLTVTAIFILFGIYLTEHIWVRAPQEIPLS